MEKLNDITVYQRAFYYLSVLREAIQGAREENRKHGLPNDFVINGKTYYELPNGEITTINPLADFKPEKSS